MPKDLSDTSESDVSSSESPVEEPKPKKTKVPAKRKSTERGDIEATSSKRAKKGLSSTSDDEVSSEEEKPKTKKAKKVKEAAQSSSEASEDEPPKVKIIKNDGESLIDLTGDRYMKVNFFKGNKYVHIRQYYTKDGETLLPGKGIALNVSQWNKFKAAIHHVDKRLAEA